MSKELFAPGARVCVKTAQDRTGVLQRIVQDNPGNRRWLVQFPDGPRKLPERNLRVLEDDQSIEQLIDGGAYGKSKHLRGAITHSRLTGRLADVIYSMEATNTEFFPYQFKPVLNFLESPSNGILIADEVGLGKTIEAGLIWTELRARIDATRLLIVCPAVLREKWRAELLHRFGIRAVVCNAEELLARLKECDSRRHVEFALIASIQGIRPPRGFEDEDDKKSAAAELARFLDDQVAGDVLFDCVIIDEAHYCRNPDSQTHKLAHMVRSLTSHIVLLSATPIQLRSADLFHLLNIIDSENFEFKEAFDAVLEANGPIVALAAKLRRGECTAKEFRNLVTDCLRHPLLAENRQLRDLLSKPPSPHQLMSPDPSARIRLANRVERVNLLSRVINRTRKRDVHGKQVVREPSAQSIPMNDVERSFYDAVTQSVRDYCEQYDLFEGFMLTIPQRQLCSSMPAALRGWRKKLAITDETLVFEMVSDDADVVRRGTLGPLVERLAELSTTIGSYEKLKAQDSKYARMLTLLQQYWETNAGSKVVLFSYYRETLFYLKERLEEDGIAVALLMGGMGDERESIIERFRGELGPDILLSSEVLSEGVDLQFSSALINYDLPWNPMRVEQRIGRIDRIGQQQPRILIWNLFYADTLDDRVYRRLFERLDIFRYALGDMEAVLGELIRELSYELLSHQLTPDQEEARIKQSAAAIAQQRHQQELLEQDAIQLQALGDYVLNRVTAAKELERFIRGESLWSYVKDFMVGSYPGSKFLMTSREPLTIKISLSLEARADLQHFLDQHPELGNTMLSRTVLGTETECLFSNHVDFGDQKREVVNQYHALVRFVASRVQADQYHPLVATSVNSEGLEQLPSGCYFFLAKRWSTRGARTEERLVYRAIRLATMDGVSDEAAERLVNRAISTGEDWLEVNAIVGAHAVGQAYGQLENRLDDEFDEYSGQMQIENEDRVDFLIATLKSRFASQIRILEEVIENARTDRQRALVPANRGKIAKLKDKRDQRIALLENQRTISSEPSDVIGGLINVS